MKFLSILGSPRRKGNTATALGWLEDEIRTKRHIVERINVADHNVNGCIECYKCQHKENAPNCSQNDDGKIILEKMVAADGLIFSSPLFVRSFSGQMKMLLDRMFCLVKAGGLPDHYSYLAGKTFALLITCGGPLERNTEEINQIFKRMVFWFGALNAGSAILPFSDLPDQPDGAAKQKTCRLAHAIIDVATNQLRQ